MRIIQTLFNFLSLAGNTITKSRLFDYIVTKVLNKKPNTYPQRKNQVPVNKKLSKRTPTWHQDNTGLNESNNNINNSLIKYYAFIKKALLAGNSVLCQQTLGAHCRSCNNDYNQHCQLLQQFIDREIIAMNQQDVMRIINSLDSFFTNQVDIGFLKILSQSIKKHHPLINVSGTRIPFLQDCLESYYNDTTLISSAALGAGLANVVYKQEYRHIKEPVVFKPDEQLSLITAASTTGINNDPNNTRMPERSIATYAVAKKLGFEDVITKTQPAIHQRKLGIVMELAKGDPQMKPQWIDINQQELTTLTRAGYQLNRLIVNDLGFINDLRTKTSIASLLNGNIKWDQTKGVWQKEVLSFVTADQRTSAVFRKQLVKLQLVDAICFHADRHLQNYFIEVNQGSIVGVKGIDNDMTFGCKIFNSQLPASQYKDYPFVVRLPHVVDTDMEQSILNLTTQDLKDTLGNFPTQAELNAATSRLLYVQQHIKNLRVSGRIIQPTDWGNNWIYTYLMETDIDAPNVATSYFAQALNVMNYSPKIQPTQPTP